MKVTQDNRKQVWDSLPAPKPNWESFKRLLRQFKGDLGRAMEAWNKKNR